MTPPPSTGDPVRDAENMRSFANQYAQMYGSDNARQMGYTGPDIPGPGQGPRPDLGVQTMDPGQMSVARGPSSPYAFMGMAGDQSNSFEREQELARLQQMQGDQPRGPDQNPSMGMATDPRPKWYGDDPGSEMRNTDGAFGGMTRPAQELNGGPLASGIFGATPNVERGANVPSWMVNNPNYNPMAISSAVMQEHTNPATGESYMGTGAGQYMVDPSLQGEFTTPDRSFSLDMGEIPEARNGSPGEGVGPTFGTQQPEVQDFGAQHRAQHEAMGDNGGGNYFGNGGGGGSMGGGVMGLPSALSFQNSYSMPTWMNSSAMNNPFNFASPGGYQTSSPFGSMSSPFGGGLPRGYYT